MEGFLTSYGRRELIIATVVCAVLGVAMGWAFWPSAAVPLAVWLFVLWFFRDPRRVPDDPAGFISPADGRVVDITPGDYGGPLAHGLRVGIFMSITSVHVNRSPCAGVVAGVEHHDGGYLDARRAGAADLNESATVLLTHRRGGREFKLAVRQVAGLIARRIVTDLRVGQELAAGQRIGMIKFGSRAELILPDELVGQVAVKVGQPVWAGKTVLVYPPREKP
jgi:phosphatidylserine decarboxylase